nr:MAG TPA: hypothetical protein [Caudoviricetes sp.]
MQNVKSKKGPSRSCFSRGVPFLFRANRAARV